MTSSFIKKENLTQVFSCEFRKIFKNTFFTENLLWLLLVISKLFEYLCYEFIRQAQAQIVRLFPVRGGLMGSAIISLLGILGMIR